MELETVSVLQRRRQSAMTQDITAKPSSGNLFEEFKVANRE